MEKDTLKELLDAIEKSMKTSNMLICFELGIALKVMEDRLWNLDNESAQRCNNLQHKIFGE